MHERDWRICNRKGLAMLGNSLRIPVLGAEAVHMRYSPLPRTGDFTPERWNQQPLEKDPNPADGGEWWFLAFPVQGLADGVYEYDFLVQQAGQPSYSVADPYAEEITRFGGYRGVLRVQRGVPIRLPFDWEGELTGDHPLPANNQMILYELPLRWV